MVNTCHLALAHSLLRGSDVKVGVVVGFPLGATLTSVKLFETTAALKLGAREIDMVINIGALKAGDHEFVQSEIYALAQAARRIRIFAEGHYRNDSAHRR